MVETRKQITYVDGKEIISRQQGYAKHPHPSQGGKLVPFVGLEHVLLDDGTETEMCAECGYTNDNAQSIIAHMTSHSDRSPSMYADETLRTIIREVLRAKKTGVKNFMEVAAHALNDMGVKPAGGRSEMFTAQSVGSLYNAHHTRYPDVRVRTTPAARPTLTPEEVAVVAKKRGKVEAAAAERRARTDDMEVVDPNQLSGSEKALVNNRVRRIDKMLRELAAELGFLDRYVSELEAKAQRYDKMKDAMKGL